MADCDANESGLGEISLSVHDEQLPLVVKKTPLRDLQNENNITNQTSLGNSVLLKDGARTEDLKASGIKRPPVESQVSPSHHHSLSTSGANGHLVYVRRKLESEVGKITTSEPLSQKGDCSLQKQLGPEEDVNQQPPQIKESRIQCLPSCSPISAASLTTFVASKPSVPLSLGKAHNRTGAQEIRGHRVVVAPPDRRKINNQNWEDRYLHLQMHLRKLDQSSQEDYLQMLRYLSSVELSRLAVDLEKRAIQLSLEEGKELQRVRALNVLGKAMRNPKPSPVQPSLAHN